MLSLKYKDWLKETPVPLSETCTPFRLNQQRESCILTKMLAKCEVTLNPEENDFCNLVGKWILIDEFIKGAKLNMDPSSPLNGPINL